ncbi:CsbD family protein [Pseudorhodoplanes sp.]|uniref:CsbD family protein n=1 Tax=Pseudorhodoplanes sp. TaxID=1934341 RepID=UPI002C9CEEC8|nr:CsbD family protein [Pseudorhodoplanes sp.]HWV42879.1 CsbD family protein [Pseudorhodoplanes sp.]
MAKSRLLAVVLLGLLVPGAGAVAQTPPAAAPATSAPAKESLRTWTWNKVSGNWKRMKGAVKERWGKLTHNEVAEARGRREALNGFIQARYGIDRETADRQIDEWLKTLK